MVGLVSIYRYNGDEINEKLANSEAQILQNAIKEKAFDHDEEVVRIITTRSKNQVLATLNRFKDDHGSSITKVKTHDDFFFISKYLISNFTLIILKIKNKFRLNLRETI